MRFDTHLHAWWPGDKAAIRIRAKIPELDRDFGIAGARVILREAGVSRAVLVSAAQEDADNARLLEIANANADLVAGVIGWLDPEAPDITDRIAHWRQEPLWRGIRMPLTIHEDRRYIARDGVGRGLAALRDAGAIAEILAAPDQLADVAAVLETLPGLRAVIDHAGTPEFATPPTPLWREGIAALARVPDAVCKVSAFWMPGDPPVQEPLALQFFAHVAATFGPDRMIAAANWPVSSLGRPYADVWEMLDRLAVAAGLDAPAIAAITAANAAALFETPQDADSRRS